MTLRITDLRLVVGLVVAAALALLVPGVPWQVEWLFGVPLLLLLPGYAVVAALFPERPRESSARTRAPDWPARFGLSLVGSALIVAVVGLLFARQGRAGLSLTPAVLSIGGVTLLGVAVAAISRMSLPRSRRADPVAGASLGSLAGGFGTTGIQSLVVVLSLVLLVSTLAFAGTTPAEDPYTEVYLTDDAGVDLGPSEGTQTIVAGTDNTLALAIENHEGEGTDYRTVIRLQRVEDGTVVETEQLDDFRVSLDPGETGVYERTLDPSMTGERLRLQVLVYEGGTDGDISAESADFVLRLWVDSTDEAST